MPPRAVACVAADLAAAADEEQVRSHTVLLVDASKSDGSADRVPADAPFVATVSGALF